MRTSRKPLLLAIAVLLAWTCGQVGAQTMLLRQAGTNLDRVTAQIGQTITIEVVADLQSVTASGVSFFLTIPDGPFQVVDEGLGGHVRHSGHRWVGMLGHCTHCGGVHSLYSGMSGWSGKISPMHLLAPMTPMRNCNAFVPKGRFT